jgi:hypothetical protein
VGQGDASGLAASEIDRLTDPVLPPAGWYSLWFLGPAEIFRRVDEPGRRSAIACRTEGDCGLLLRDVTLPLEPGTRLRWSWRIDALPSDGAENTLLTHDYTSVAVEFDNGQDLTYFWSAALPCETAFRCPIPLWSRRETHLAVRSGADGLGTWLTEGRDVYADTSATWAGPRGHGSCGCGSWAQAVPAPARDRDLCRHQPHHPGRRRGPPLTFIPGRGGRPPRAHVRAGPAAGAINER